MRLLRGGKGKPKIKRHSFSLQPVMAEEAYQASEFLIPSQDSHGHSSKAITLVSTDVKRLMTEIIASKAVPHWGTEGDLIRWCIHTGIDALMNRLEDEKIKASHAAMRDWLDSQSRVLEIESWQSNLLAMKLQIKKLVSGGHYIPAWQHVVSMKMSLKKFHNDYWRAIFQKELVEANIWLKKKADEQEKKLTLSKSRKQGTDDDE